MNHFPGQRERRLNVIGNGTLGFYQLGNLNGGEEGEGDYSIESEKKTAVASIDKGTFSSHSVTRFQVTWSRSTLNLVILLYIRARNSKDKRTKTSD